jgi:biotin carboxyl carrier protein
MINIKRFPRTLAWAVSVGSMLAGQPKPLLAQAAPAPGTIPVALPQRGNVAALFVTTGEQVRRGQLLAKLEQPNGQAFYVSAPAAGRVTWVALPPQRPLPAHTVLATVAAAATATP